MDNIIRACLKDCQVLKQNLPGEVIHCNKPQPACHTQTLCLKLNPQCSSLYVGDHCVYFNFHGPIYKPTQISHCRRIGKALTKRKKKIDTADGQQLLDSYYNDFSCYTQEKFKGFLLFTRIYKNKKSIKIATSKHCFKLLNQRAVLLSNSGKSTMKIGKNIYIYIFKTHTNNQASTP